MLKNKRLKIVQLLQRSKIEWNEYERAENFTNLSQACEKTWVAFLLALEHVSGQEIRGFRDREYYAKIHDYEKLLNRTARLHMIHYEGSPDLTNEEIEYNLKLAWADIKTMIAGTRIIKVRGHSRRFKR